MRKVTLEEILARPPTAKNAYNAVHWATRRGILERPMSCDECSQIPVCGIDGRKTIQAHHRLGYEHPLDVVWLCVRCHSIEEKRPAMLGARNINFLLTPEVVTDVAARTLAGETQRQIAAALGISNTTVWRAQKGMYNHV